MRRIKAPGGSGQPLLETVEDLMNLKATFRAPCRFLRQVRREVRDMAEMEVGTANSAMRIFRDDVFCGAEEVRKGFFHSRLGFVRGQLSLLFHDRLRSRTSMWLWPQQVCDLLSRNVSVEFQTL